MENIGYLFAAFLVVWMGIIGYLLVIFGRQKRISREIEMLEKSLTEKSIKQ
ncbi:MAG: CcmD family protein [Gammaproteobacteria bacterium]|nr:CcmD family protein [Gammaproteobacteria bacterium]